ncbi:dihydrofolate reductase family protein [Agromyces sp. SYSU K20354]|uniref:dihydrofolate reductase family protein n=1 Tax=Agromyces cavernae TaxID=2898659 RepID=UPI001E511FC1|nr:dihydrofolate reductase family protein [Agromyces cavernae]MCD2443008.1 dihydrofolate reductase family protein [Agromyces cavernae]
MGTIVADLFVTLDGVYQAPGGANEDDEGGFEFGGWQAPYFDGETGEALDAGFADFDALLLGRKTYDIFAGYWPKQSADMPIARKLNEVPKFVVSHTPFEPTWQGTTVLTEVSSEIAPLKQRFGTTRVIGSGHLVQSLLEADLVDRLNLYVYPITFGSGKSLFTRGVPAAFTLAEPPRAFPKGAVLLAYDRAGAPVTGIDIDA